MRRGSKASLPAGSVFLKCRVVPGIQEFRIQRNVNHRDFLNTPTLSSVLILSARAFSPARALETSASDFFKKKALYSWPIGNWQLIAIYT